jgi:hypothetical protein
MKLSIQAAWRAPLAHPSRLLIASALLFAPLAGLAAIWLTLVASAAFLQAS